MKPISCLLAALVLLVCAGCDANGSVQGGGSENSSYGRVKIGVPF